jgi:hypothetical protein
MSERSRYSRIVQLMPLSVPQWFVWANADGNPFTFICEPVHALALVEEWWRNSYDGPSTPTDDDENVERVIYPVACDGSHFEIVDHTYDYFDYLVAIVFTFPGSERERTAMDAKSREHLQRLASRRAAKA